MIDVKIRIMKPEERLHHFNYEAQKLLANYESVMEAKKIIVGKNPQKAEEGMKELEEKYNIRLLPQLQVQAMLWPDEVKALEEQQAKEPSGKMYTGNGVDEDVAREVAEDAAKILEDSKE